MSSRVPEVIFLSPEQRETFGRIADSFEKWLIRLIAVLAFLTLAAQLLLRSEEFRRYASEADRAEGIPYGPEAMGRWLDRYYGGEGSFNR